MLLLLSALISFFVFSFFLYLHLCAQAQMLAKASEHPPAPLPPPGPGPPLHRASFSPVSHRGKFITVLGCLANLLLKHSRVIRGNDVFCWRHAQQILTNRVAELRACLHYRRGCALRRMNSRLRITRHMLSVIQQDNVSITSKVELLLN